METNFIQQHTNNALTLEEIAEANAQIETEIDKCNKILNNDDYQEYGDPLAMHELTDSEMLLILEVAEHYKECLETMKHFRYRAAI